MKHEIFNQTFVAIVLELRNYDEKYYDIMKIDNLIYQYFNVEKIEITEKFIIEFYTECMKQEMLIKKIDFDENEFLRKVSINCVEFYINGDLNEIYNDYVDFVNSLMENLKGIIPIKSINEMSVMEIIIANKHSELFK